MVDTDSSPDAVVWEQPMGTRRPLKVICVGMGASGINLAYQLERRSANVELVVYEKNDRVGGTWYENVYDGCACDAPSVCYQFSWDRKPDWSRFYAGSDEIHRYLEHLAEKHRLLRFAKFQHELVKAEWLNDVGKWEVTVRDASGHQFTDQGDFLVNGSGVLNNWSWPAIRGLNSFKGKLMHTARWDRTYDTSGKCVLHIGIGSSGVQLVPKLVEKVDRLHVVARSPTWIIQGLEHPMSSKQTGNFTCGLSLLATELVKRADELGDSEEVKEKFRQDPEFYLRYCKAVESPLNTRFNMFIQGTPEAAGAKRFLTNDMTRRLQGRADLVEGLIPKDFAVGCRRPTPADGFLEALTQDKTTVHFGTIREVNETGFFDKENKHHEVDMISCATGFDTSFKPRFAIRYDGKNLQDEMSKEVVGYLGISAPEVPNYFVFIGAYGPYGHGSVLAFIEAYTEYVMQVLDKAQTDHIKRLSVKRAAAEDFTRYADKFIERTAWSGSCSSWFRNNSVKKPVPWPGSRISCLTALERPRFEHYDIEYLDGNSCSFLGNGFATRELDGKDVTWYMGLIGNEDRQNNDFKMDVDDGSGNFGQAE